MTETLLLMSLVVCSGLAGLSIALIISVILHRKLLLESMEHCDKLKKEFAIAVQQASELNNNLVNQIANINDRMLAFEMMLKGAKR